MSRVTWGDSKMGSNFKKTPMHTKIMKLNSKDPQKRPKWGPNRYLRPPNSWKSQKNIKSIKKRKFLYVFQKSRRHKSANAPFKNHPKSCLRAKTDFWLLESHKISKSEPKVSPMGLPKSTQTREKSFLGHPMVHLPATLAPNDRQSDAKVIPLNLNMPLKWSLKTSKDE